MDFKNRTFLASLAATFGVVIVAGLGIVALGAQQGPPPGRGPGARGPGMFGAGPRGPMAGMMRRGLAQLNLTDDQKTRIKSTLESNRDATQAIAKRMIAAREALGDAVTADTIVEADIRAKAAAVAVVEADAAVLRANVRAQVFALLTPEQVAKAKQLRAVGNGRIKQFLGRMLGRDGRGGPGGPGRVGGWF
ncbi:MAG: Spy/CpxP family protein refolding chaperone [Acidobacteria bacterium]|nr:Spy/CpxP family protein refolding chaperone [Acidobacteriota bacterium]